MPRISQLRAWLKAAQQQVVEFQAQLDAALAAQAAAAVELPEGKPSLVAIAQAYLTRHGPSTTRDLAAAAEHLGFTFKKSRPTSQVAVVLGYHPDQFTFDKDTGLWQLTRPR